MQGPSLQHLGEAEAPGFIPGGSFFQALLKYQYFFTGHFSLNVLSYNDNFILQF
jgi:hypothetical protein